LPLVIICVVKVADLPDTRAKFSYAFNLATTDISVISVGSTGAVASRTVKPTATFAPVAPEAVLRKARRSPSRPMSFAILTVATFKSQPRHVQRLGLLTRRKGQVCLRYAC